MRKRASLWISSPSEGHPPSALGWKGYCTAIIQYDSGPVCLALAFRPGGCSRGTTCLSLSALISQRTRKQIISYHVERLGSIDQHEVLKSKTTVGNVDASSSSEV
eukprot:scaffold2738_cov119-Cylindrotheca_fusiformis.AAC.13